MTAFDMANLLSEFISLTEYIQSNKHSSLVQRRRRKEVIREINIGRVKWGRPALTLRQIFASTTRQDLVPKHPPR